MIAPDPIARLLSAIRCYEQAVAAGHLEGPDGGVVVERLDVAHRADGWALVAVARDELEIRVPVSEQEVQELLHAGVGATIH